MILVVVLSIGIGVLVGVGIMAYLNKRGLAKAKLESEDIINEANSKADTTVRQATLEGKQRIYEMQLQAEKEIKDQKDKIQQIETKLLRREDNLNFREENLANSEKKITERNKSIDNKLAELGKKKEELQNRIDEQVQVLEKVAHLSQEDAHKELMDMTAKMCEKEVAQYIHEQQEEAENQATENARNVIAAAEYKEVINARQ